MRSPRYVMLRRRLVTRLAFLALFPVVLVGCGPAAHRLGASPPTVRAPDAVVSTSTTVDPVVSQIDAAIAALRGNPTYPAAIPARTDAVNSGVGCPSLAGVDVSATPALAHVVALENAIEMDLASRNDAFVGYFDQTLLAMPENGFAQLFVPSFGDTSGVPLGVPEVELQPLHGDPTLAGSVGGACGKAVVSASWRVVFCNGATQVAACDPGITTTELVIDRNRTWLVWYVGSGLQ